MDGVCYSIDWGDGQTEITDYYYSSDVVTVSHTWIEEGEYEITVLAIDFYGNESEAKTLEIIVPRVKVNSYNLKILQLFEKFPNVYKIFRQLLRL